MEKLTTLAAVTKRFSWGINFPKIIRNLGSDR